MGRQARTKQIRRQIRRDVSTDMIKTLMGETLRAYDHDPDISCQCMGNTISLSYVGMRFILPIHAAYNLVSVCNEAFQKWYMQSMLSLGVCSGDEISYPYVVEMGTTSVEITDNSEVHCFRLKLQGTSTLFHGRSLVDLSQKVSKALLNGLDIIASDFA